MKRPTCPNRFNVGFGRKLVRFLGGDASKIHDNWCWREFFEAFPDLKHKTEKFFKTARTGDPAFAAYCMVQYCGSSREWGEKVIEKAMVGDPAYAAYRMVQD